MVCMVCKLVTIVDVFASDVLQYDGPLEDLFELDYVIDCSTRLVNLLPFLNFWRLL